VKTIRLIALLAAVSLAACVQTPTTPDTSASDAKPRLEGTGFAGSGT
jgi:hypothetical protein